MFHWEPEGPYRNILCKVIVPFWFSTEHHWIGITPFWLSTDDIWIFASCSYNFIKTICAVHFVSRQWPYRNCIRLSDNWLVYVDMVSKPFEAIFLHFWWWGKIKIYRECYIPLLLSSQVLNLLSILLQNPK